MKSNILLSTLAALLLLTTACSKENKDEAAAAAPVGATCINCTGFVPGAVVYSGTVSNGGSRIDGLQVIAEANSLATATQSYSPPKTKGTYEALVNAGTFTSVSNACLPDGTYAVTGFKAGTISQNLTAQSTNPMWVTLSGPISTKATIYVVLADQNSDDVADAGTKVYLWVNCNGWTRIDLTAY
jgi:hypothetical protein